MLSLYIIRFLSMQNHLKHLFNQKGLSTLYTKNNERRIKRTFVIHSTSCQERLQKIISTRIICRSGLRRTERPETWTRTDIDGRDMIYFQLHCMVHTVWTCKIGQFFQMKHRLVVLNQYRLIFDRGYHKMSSRNSITNLVQ